MGENGEYLVMKIGRFGRYLTSADENEKSKNISLKGINIPIEDIKNGKIYVKKILEESNRKRRHKN